MKSLSFSRRFLIFCQQHFSVVGGYVPSKPEYRFRRMIVVCVLAGAACFFVAAGYSFSQLLIAHGGREGNILRIGFGLLSFLIGILLLVAGTLSWKS
jgi:hypothetical protein